MADKKRVLAYHPNLTGEGSKSQPIEMTQRHFNARQRDGWKTAPATKSGNSDQEK